MKKSMIKVLDLIPDAVEELIYATKDNFTGSPVYPPNATAYLFPEPAKKLKRAQEILRQKGFRLKIWDAYRPHSVQKIFWERVPDPRYVGDPTLGSKHNRGAAVDVTLIDLQGNELPMQSAFDDFSERAHRNYKGCDPQLLSNVAILTNAMLEAGFEIYESEWWHFQSPDWEDYPILDLSFESLQGQPV